MNGRSIKHSWHTLHCGFYNWLKHITGININTMNNFGKQRYLNDMLMRMAALQRCMAAVDSNQLGLSDHYQDLARESLIEEYQRTAKQVRAELDDEYPTVNNTANS